MKPEQGELIPLPPMPTGAGDIERATRASLEAADLADADQAGAASLLGAARLLDIELAKGKTYAYAQLFTQWRELLAAFRLTPASRGGDKSDPADAFLRALSEAGPG